jgi:hypothetical protein
MMQK